MMDDKELFDTLFEGLDEALDKITEPFEGDERLPSMVIQILMSIASTICVAEGGTREGFLAFAEDEFLVAIEDEALRTLDDKEDFDVN
jgi:hypothetical protein